MKYEEFDRITDLCNDVHSRVAKVHQIAGTCICYFMSSKMLNSMIDIAKETENKETARTEANNDFDHDIPKTLYNRLYTFCSMFCELDEKLDDFNISPKNTIGSESVTNTSKVEKSPELSRPLNTRNSRHVLTQGINEIPKPPLVGLNTPKKEEDPWKTNTESNKINFNPSKPISDNPLSGGGLGSRPKIGGSSTFGSSFTTAGIGSKPTGKYKCLPWPFKPFWYFTQFDFW